MYLNTARLFMAVFAMESASHYYIILYQFCRDAGFEVVVVNPIQSGTLRSINRMNLYNVRGLS